MTSISDELADRFVSYGVDLQRLSSKVEGEVISFMELLELSLIVSLQEASLSKNTSKAFRKARLQVLLKGVQATLAETYDNNKILVESYLTEVTAVSVAAASKNINAAIGVDLVSPLLTQERVKSIVSSVLVEGGPLKEHWKRNEKKTLNAYKDQVRLGIARGESTEEIVNRVAGTPTGKVKGYKTKAGKQRFLVDRKGGITNIAKRDATSLVRTSIQAVANSANFELFKKNDDLIKGIQPLVTLDNKTTLFCMSLSGSAWTLEGVPLTKTSRKYPGLSPYHYQCRTLILPILKTFEEIAGNVSDDIREKLKSAIPKSKQASMDGLVAGDLTYEDWLRTKPKKFQREVLGKTKFKLWSSGVLGFRDLVDQAGNPISVAALKKKYL